MENGLSAGGKRCKTGPAVMLLGFCGLFVFLLAHSHTVRLGVKQGLSMAVQSVVPSLFTFSVLCDFAVSQNLFAPLERVLAKPFSYLFHLPGAGVTAFLLGMAGGYPMGARCVARLYAERKLDRESAEQLLSFCNNCGPAFLFAVAMPVLKGGIWEGCALWAIHLVSAVLVGILMRKNPRRPMEKQLPEQQHSDKPWTVALADAVSGSALAMVRLTAFLCLFRVGIAFLPWENIMLKGTVELFSGIGALSDGAYVQAGWLLGFGGFCVVGQTGAECATVGLSCKRYIVGKLLQGLLAAGMCLLILL